MMYSEPGQGTLERVMVSDFSDFEFPSVGGNTSKLKASLPLDRNYLEGFLSSRYSEKVDYNPNSKVNEVRGILGLPKQGKLRSKVTMYMNKYSMKYAVKLFGALKGKGAQLPK